MVLELGFSSYYLSHSEKAIHLGLEEDEDNDGRRVWCLEALCWRWKQGGNKNNGILEGGESGWGTWELLAVMVGFYNLWK